LGGTIALYLDGKRVPLNDKYTIKINKTKEGGEIMTIKIFCMFFSMPFYVGDSFILKACGTVYILLCIAYKKVIQKICRR